MYKNIFLNKILKYVQQFSTESAIYCWTTWVLLELYLGYVKIYSVSFLFIKYWNTEYER